MDQILERTRDYLYYFIDIDLSIFIEFILTTILMYFEYHTIKRPYSSLILEKDPLFRSYINIIIIIRFLILIQRKDIWMKRLFQNLKENFKAFVMEGRFDLYCIYVLYRVVKKSLRIDLEEKFLRKSKIFFDGVFLSIY